MTDRRNKPAELVRSQRLQIRLTVREERALQQRADHARMTVSEYVRERVLA